MSSDRAKRRETSNTKTITITMRLTILNYNTGKVYQAILPNNIQDIIDNNHSGDWEDFLDLFAGDVWRQSECYYMTHEDEDVQMIEITDTGIEFIN